MKRIHAAATGMALLLGPAMISPGLAAADQFTWPAGSGKPIDIVIQRALSQRGVPYVYGGGGISGPTNGVRPDAKARLGAATLPGLAGLPGRAGLPGLTPAPGTVALPGAAIAPGGALPATTVGFDSSGLIQYAFAGAGIKMPRTSGEQCSVGRKVPPAQAQRGDLICYGPGGTQSVALFLGNGQMIEGTDPVVAVSAARTSNMAPYLTRIIES
ncbi:MAG TPA: NlpC/P60 family peptidoglycan-binding protein RipD [Mycobacterium sp.]|nr:NlpC/P60 family peptidoglycan-binding protein RipD [Mycobacterium sp.]